MGFADYLNRHTNSAPAGENINENHVINTLTAVKYKLHTNHRKLANHKARYIDALNDFKNYSNWNERKQSVFAIYTLANSRFLICKEVINLNFHHSQNFINPRFKISKTTLTNKLKQQNT